MASKTATKTTPPKQRVARKPTSRSVLPSVAKPMLAITAKPHVPSLNEDAETSLTVSLGLHLMSEHGIPNALSMDEGEQQVLHEKLHEPSTGIIHHHGVHDHRFRPGTAFAVLKEAQLRRQRRHTDVQQLIFGRL